MMQMSHVANHSGIRLILSYRQTVTGLLLHFATRALLHIRLLYTTHLNIGQERLNQAAEALPSPALLT